MREVATHRSVAGNSVLEAHTGVVIIRPKSVALAGLLEFLFPGLGLIYATNMDVGVTVMVGTFGAYAAAIGANAALWTEAAREAAEGQVATSAVAIAWWIGIGFGVLMLAWGVARILWARASARHYRQRFPLAQQALVKTPLFAMRRYTVEIWEYTGGKIEGHFTLDRFYSFGDAQTACRRVVEEWMAANCAPGMSATELVRAFQLDGDHPTLLNGEGEAFPVEAYAHEVAARLCR